MPQYKGYWRGDGWVTPQQQQREAEQYEAGVAERTRNTLEGTKDPFKIYGAWNDIYQRSASPDDKLGRYGLMQLIANRGFGPGEFDRILGSLTQDLQRAGGARLGLQSALLNQRNAGLPGGGGTAFQDAGTNALFQEQNNAANQALSQARQGLTQYGLDVRNNALGQLFADESAAAGRRKDKDDKGAGIVSGLATLGTGIAAAASSIDYKQDVKPANTTSLLDAVKGLNVVNFKYKDGMVQNGQMEDPTKEHVGLLAEESPNMIKADEKSLSLPDMLGLLMGAFQELMKEFEALKQKMGNDTDFQQNDEEVRIY